MTDPTMESVARCYAELAADNAHLRRAATALQAQVAALQAKETKLVAVLAELLREPLDATEETTGEHHHGEG